jgi:hypothetical protein
MHHFPHCIQSNHMSLAMLLKIPYYHLICEENYDQKFRLVPLKNKLSEHLL